MPSAEAKEDGRQDERMRSRRLPTLLIVAAASTTLVACGGSGGKGDAPAPAPTGATAAPGTAAKLILVTNDDGVAAPGIDALARRLTALPGVTVRVVAPSGNRSGSGGQTTPGTLVSRPAKTSSGLDATAVDGFPADTVRVALDDLKLQPAFVVSGANEGQNVGPIAAISGTVGAARAAAQRGIPALAVSTGRPSSGNRYDFDVAADLAARQVEKTLPGAGAATPDTATIGNLNVPSCPTGQVRSLQELPASTKPDARALEASNCTSTAPPSDEITSFLDGFAVLTRIPARA
ncbi:MAG: 5/3-nucleotidase [Frankiaceae bacterium]|nr:5/3-nucleotidase [Frankiaceae bacterium]